MKTSCPSCSQYTITWPKPSQKGWLFLKIKHNLHSVYQKILLKFLFILSADVPAEDEQTIKRSSKSNFFGTHWYRFFHSIFIIIIIRWRSRWSKSGATSPQTCRAPLPVLHSHKYLQTRISYKLKLGQEQYLLNKVF